MSAGACDLAAPPGMSGGRSGAICAGSEVTSYEEPEVSCVLPAALVPVSRTRRSRVPSAGVSV